MALPFSRQLTLAALSQVPSSLLNNLQDSHTILRNRPVHIPGAGFQIIGDTPADVVFGYGGSVRSVAASGNKVFFVDLSPYLITGDVIKEITWRWRNGATAAAGSMVFSLARATVAAPFTDVSINSPAAQNTSSGGANALRTLLAAAIAHTVLADNFYALVVEMDTTAGNDQAGFGGVTVQLGV